MALDPFQSAEAELRDLIGRGLLEKNLVKQFYVSLSEIVKKILEAGYSIQTIEKTTAEILEELQPRIAEEGNLAELGKFKLLLSGSDLVKFARHIPSRADHELFIQSAFECLESCRSRKRRIEQASLAQAGEEK